MHSFSHDFLMFDFETTCTWPEQGGKITEFGATVIDRKTLEVKEEFHVYVKIDKADYDNSSDWIKNFHKDRWDIYLGKTLPEGKVIIDQSDFAELFKLKFGKGNYQLCAWSMEFDLSWLRWYFFINNDLDFFTNFTRYRVDLKSMFQSLFILNKQEQFVVTSKNVMNAFGLGDVSHDALEDCKNQSKLLKLLCDVSN